MGHIQRLRRTLPRDPPSLLDLGMGRGRDLICFARRGFRVLGVDLASEAIEKGERRAERLGVAIRTVRADLRSYRPRGRFDVVYSNGTLSCLPPELRAARFGDFQSATVRGGIHAVNVFVPGPRGPSPPDEQGLPYRPGELANRYAGWEILESREIDFPCHYRGGAPHRHRLEALVARKLD